MRQTFRTLAIAALSSVALGGSLGAAQAQTEIFKSLLGFGDDQPPINYSERAPLVIPKKRELVTPGEQAVSDPNWPKDPDEEKRRKAKEESSMATFFGQRKSDAPLSPDELRSTGYAEDDMEKARAAFEYERRASNRLDPDVLRKQKLGTVSTQVELIPGQEPPRRSLAEPPPGLRTPLASAPVDGTIELPTEAAAKAKRNWLDFTSN